MPVNNTVFTVYGMDNCPSCDKAKRLLEKEHLGYTYIDLLEDEDAQKMFKEKNLRSVPQVFYSNILIGGYENLKHYLETPSGSVLAFDD